MKKLSNLILLYLVMIACSTSHYSLKQQKPMFTLEQIKTAHAKVKSGTDFPAYIQELIKLGVVHYETYVLDGHTEFIGREKNTLISDPKYNPLIVSNSSNKEQFKKDLKEHQQGKTNYHTFCQICANLGVEKWVVDLHEMTCTYYDKNGDEMLVESIPTV